MIHDFLAKLAGAARRDWFPRPVELLMVWPLPLCAVSVLGVFGFMVASDQAGLLTRLVLVLLSALPLVVLILSLSPASRNGFSRSEPVVRVELEQILLRIVLATAIFLYAAGFLWVDGESRIRFLRVLDVLGTGLVVAWLLLADLVLTWRASVRRRVLAVFGDLGFLSLVMVVGGEPFLFWHPIYLWVIFGNGFRFGPRYLLLATAVGLVGFCAVLVFGDAPWSSPYMGAGLLLSLVLLPVYVLVLIEKLERARAEAEEADRTKGRFLARMSHELRTPLTAIILNSAVDR